MSPTTERKYNPGFLTEDELVAGLCVRKAEFESILEMLRECTGSANQHQIVIGPRGSGKTTLLLRIAAELRRDADMARAFFPVVFAEESYEVATAGEFWLECVSRLAGQAPRSDGTPDLQRTFDDLRTVRDDQALADRCLATVLDFADRENKRLVLIVENLNMMFHDMADPDAGWRLRHVLQNEPRIVLLASATSRFDEIDRPDHALYDLFRVLTLRPLDTDECAALWEAASGESRPRETVRSLEILTGGSPRLLAIVAHFSAGLSFRQLMNSLLDLVDAHTEYFKSHLEALPAQERRVYLALADLWKPALAKEIADRARTETGKCSAQLARLVERGAVLVAGGSPRRKQYYLSERLYNIYYLLRRNSGANRVVEVLIRFMASYYSPAELKEIVDVIVREAAELPAEMRSPHQFAFRRLIALPALAEDEDVQAFEAGRLCDEGIELSNQGRHEDALRVYRDLVSQFGESTVPDAREAVAVALYNSGVTFGSLGRYQEELATYDQVLRRFGGGEERNVLTPVAGSLLNKGGVLRLLKQPEEAIAAYDELAQRFGESQTLPFVAYAAAGLLNQGLTFADLNRSDQELGAYDELLQRFGESDVPAVLEANARALVNKGIALRALGRPEEALAVYDEMLRRFRGSDVPLLLEGVARALTNKGVALQTLNRPAEALAAYDEAKRRLGREVPTDQETVATTTINRGVALGQLDRTEEELAAYDEVLSQVRESEAPGLLGLAMQAFARKALSLAKMGRPFEVPDVESLLTILPKLDSLPSYVLNTLIAYSAQLGPARTRELILASPAADSLVPLTTALEREMGLEPRVAVEVEEVAKDIQRELAKLKRAPST